MNYADMPAEDVPSILDQTKWRCGFFNFGMAGRGSAPVRWFNPGIIMRGDEEWLIVRRSEDVPNHRFGLNSIWAFRLGANHHPAWGKKISFDTDYKEQHYEDPRIIRLDENRFLLSYTTFVMEVDGGNAVWYGAHQQVAITDNDFNVMSVADPVYGFNGGSVVSNFTDGARPGMEKNWLWFLHNGRLHTVYSTTPDHTVLGWGRTLLKPDNYWKTWPDAADAWKYGQVRGGTPPVRVGDLYWSFFHSSTEWKDGKRRYHMGAYAFTADRPFRIREFTLTPILTGSIKDPWEHPQPLVVFPCGAYLKDGVWTVSLGVNDMASAWIEIPHEELSKLTTVFIENEYAKRIETSDAELEARIRDGQNTGGVAKRSRGRGVGGANVQDATVSGGSGDSAGLGSGKKSSPKRRRIRRGRGPRLRNDPGVRLGNQLVADACGAVGA